MKTDEKRDNFRAFHTSCPEGIGRVKRKEFSMGLFVGFIGGIYPVDDVTGVTEDTFPSENGIQEFVTFHAVDLFLCVLSGFKQEFFQFFFGHEDFVFKLILL